MSTPKYVTWLWEKFGKKIQPAADQIQEWDMPEWAKPIISKVSEVLVGMASMKWMEKFAKEVCSKYDEEFATKLIKAVANVFKKEEI